MTFNGVTVTPEWVQGVTKDYFFQHEAHHGFTKEEMEVWWQLLQANKEANKGAVEDK